MRQVIKINQRLNELNADIQYLIQKRREAHGNDEEQNLINIELSACYSEQEKLWKEKNRLLKK